jgi:hypothetical protein
MKKRSEPACRQVRAALQAWADGASIPEGAQAHLAHCRRCRSFQQFLAAYPHALQEGLAARMRDWPSAGIQAILSARPGGPAADGAAAAAGSQPRRRPLWAVAAAAAAALLVAGWGATRLYDSLRTARVVRAELSAAVERLYTPPLADGVESALRRPDPDIERLLEGLGPENGLEGLGEDGYLD